MIIETRHIPRDIGITLLRTLCLLAEHDDINCGDLARYLGLTNAGTTGLVDTAETAKLVKRVPSPEDRRIKLLKLTREGQAVVCGLQPKKEVAP